MKKYLFNFLLLIILVACKKDPEIVNTVQGAVLPSSPQRNGNAAIGFQYLIEGDYLNSGIPFDIYKLAFQNDADDLGRLGINKGINYQYTASKSNIGVNVVSQNCLRCHAQKIDNKIIVGLGNNLSNYTVNENANLTTIEFGIKQLYGINSNEWKAYEQFGKGAKAIAPQVLTSAFGVNPADKVFAVLAGHRNATDLKWNDASAYEVPSEVIPTDVPAWWLLKKKNALYYNGLGQGDFARLSMASALLTMKDSTDARKIDNKFADVISYIKSIEAPKYPYAIDKNLSEKGKVVFDNNCAKCHGTYGANPTYPNYLIALNKVGTDATLSQLYKSYPQYTDWFNKSWFSQTPFSAKLMPQDGYVAPPLDGIWATAPYLHNGSVPTIEDLLLSSQRPKFWKRTSESNDKYNQLKLGWEYATLTSKTDALAYDTTLKGYGNGGHTFGDGLSLEDRKALVEYLKGL